MTSENIQRLEHILNHLTYEYAPERGITANFIAVCLNAYGVQAPPCTLCIHPSGPPPASELTDELTDKASLIPAAEYHCLAESPRGYVCTTWPNHDGEHQAWVGQRLLDHWTQQ